MFLGSRSLECPGYCAGHRHSGAHENEEDIISDLLVWQIKEAL